MTEKIHWFTGKEDCESFFGRMAKNNEDKITPNFCFEGNSGTTFEWIIDASKIVGWENIGVKPVDYSDSDINFCDEIFIRIKDIEKFKHGYVDLCADEVSLESNDDGIYIRVWWD